MMDLYKEEVINKLNELGISFEIKEHDALFTMSTYEEIEKEMEITIPKNLFLNTQNHQNFYLLIMPGSKKFKTKELSSQINSSRLSFGSDEKLNEYLHCYKGSTSALGLLFDKENKVQLLIDSSLLSKEYLGFHPCNNSFTVKIKTSDFIEKFLPNVNHKFIEVKLSDE